MNLSANACRAQAEAYRCAAGYMEELSRGTEDTLETKAAHELAKKLRFKSKYWRNRAKTCPELLMKHQRSRLKSR